MGIWLILVFLNPVHQAVVQYMADHVAKRDSKSEPAKKKKRKWFRFLFWFCSGALPSQTSTEKDLA